MQEPSLETIEDYNGKESSEKRLTVWIVVLSGLLIGAVYGIIMSNSTVSDLIVDKDTTGIVKY
ncbi:MAG: hypothetical protein FAF03_00110 [Epsilonproteobacteria bacterium]|nr:hypothetical protein [Campylobacterota bacterium]